MVRQAVILPCRGQPAERNLNRYAFVVMVSITCALQASRELAQEQVQQLAEAMSSRDTSGMIIVDDNMFYRSMRKQIFLIAKRSTQRPL